MNPLSRDFRTHTPGFWPDATEAEWSDWRWQLRHRITSLEEAEKHLRLTPDEREGLLLTRHKLAFAITPHYFNLIEPDNPDCPIRRQVIPRAGEAVITPGEMADPCGEDSPPIADRDIDSARRSLRPVKSITSTIALRTKAIERTPEGAGDCVAIWLHPPNVSGALDRNEGRLAKLDESSLRDRSIARRGAKRPHGHLRIRDGDESVLQGAQRSNGSAHRTR